MTGSCCCACYYARAMRCAYSAPPPPPEGPSLLFYTLQWLCRYCQGMNFITAVALSVMTEAQVCHSSFPSLCGTRLTACVTCI